MTFLLVMTVVFGVGKEPVDMPIGLIEQKYCMELGQLVAADIMTITTAVSVSYTCTEQESL